MFWNNDETGWKSSWQPQSSKSRSRSCSSWLARISTCSFLTKSWHDSRPVYETKVRVSISGQRKVAKVNQLLVVGLIKVADNKHCLAKRGERRMHLWWLKAVQIDTCSCWLLAVRWADHQERSWQVSACSDAVGCDSCVQQFAGQAQEELPVWALNQHHFQLNWKAAIEILTSIETWMEFHLCCVVLVKKSRSFKWLFKITFDDRHLLSLLLEL